MTDSSLHRAKDTAFALVLVLLLVGYFWELPRLIPAAMIALLVAMVYPRIYGPAAVAWFGLSHVMGAVVSKVILTVVYLLVATPVALVRRVMGADSMRFRDWKKGGSSVMVERNHVFRTEDLQRPF